MLHSTIFCFRESICAKSADVYKRQLNAHYTSPTVIRGIYGAVERMGFRSGNILEPSMGVGNFFGMLPDLSLIHISSRRRGNWAARAILPSSPMRMDGTTPFTTAIIL